MLERWASARDQQDHSSQAAEGGQVQKEKSSLCPQIEKHLQITRKEIRVLRKV